MIKITKLFFLSISLSSYALNAADSTREIESLRTSLRRTERCQTCVPSTMIAASIPLAGVGIILCGFSCIAGETIPIAGIAVSGSACLLCAGSICPVYPLEKRIRRIQKQLLILTREPSAERMEAAPSYESIKTQPQVVMPIFLPPSYEESSYQNQ